MINGTSGRSRSAIDDSSAARRAELRRLTQNLVSSATDRTAAALRESGLSLGTLSAASTGSVATGRSYSGAGGIGTARASAEAAGITWRTPGGLEYSISPPARTDSGGSDGGSARQLTLSGVSSPPSRLRSPPKISSAERVQRQQQRAQQHQEYSSPGGSLSAPIERATAAVAASASALRSASPQHRGQLLPQEHTQTQRHTDTQTHTQAQTHRHKTKAERQPVTPTPGKAWIDIEETPLRPPPTRDGANSGGYSAVIGGPNDDPFAGPKLRGPAADPAEEQRDGDGGSSGGDDAGGDSISVSQLRQNIQQHIDPASSPIDAESGAPGAQATAPEESEQLSAKREKVLQIRRERELAKQQAEARARDKAEQALRDKQMREARQERRLSEQEHRLAEVKAAKNSTKASASKKKQQQQQQRPAAAAGGPIDATSTSTPAGLEADSGQASVDETDGADETATDLSATMQLVA